MARLRLRETPEDRAAREAEWKAKEAAKNVEREREAAAQQADREAKAREKLRKTFFASRAPVGGWDDYSALFHEGGHTEHFANVDPALPFEFRYLGDNSITESYAMLFDHRMQDRGWLLRYTKLGTNRVAKFLRTAGLVHARREGRVICYRLATNFPEPLLEHCLRELVLLSRAVQSPGGEEG